MAKLKRARARNDGSMSSRTIAVVGSLCLCACVAEQEPDRQAASLPLLGVTEQALEEVELRQEVIEHATVSLNVGQHIFLDGPQLGEGAIPLTYEAERHSRRHQTETLSDGTEVNADWCTSVALRKDVFTGALPPPCIEYKVRVPTSGWRLRVGYDHQDADGIIADLELWDPSNNYRNPKMKRTRAQGVLDSAEAHALNPEAGEWVVRVIPVDIRGEKTFRIRVILDRLPSAPPDGKFLLPNLRAEVPHALSFESGVIVDTGGPQGCIPSEDPGEGHRCLRFPFGYGNTGDGPLELQFHEESRSGEGDDTILTLRAEQYAFKSQKVDDPATYADNPLEIVAKDAGTATYHPTHGHFHYDAVLNAGLHQVSEHATVDECPSPASGEAPPMKDLGPATKRGNCAHDWVLQDYDKWYQDTRGLADSGDSCLGLLTDNPVQGLRIGLSRGWGDIYVASLPDNYVPIRNDAVGCFVLRVHIDPKDRVVETKKNDNVGYTYFHLGADDRIEVIERGHGSDPWDSAKEVLAPREYGE